MLHVAFQRIWSGGGFYRLLRCKPFDYDIKRPNVVAEGSQVNLSGRLIHCAASKSTNSRKKKVGTTEGRLADVFVARSHWHNR